MNEGLPPGLTEGDLPHHHRGVWTRDAHWLSPDGHHFATLYAINEERMGYETARLLWARTDAPQRFLGTIQRLPLMTALHWLDDQRFAVKLYAYQRDWQRPMVVIDLTDGFAVLPNSNGPALDLALLSAPITEGFAPYSETALAVEADLTHLL